MTLTQRSDPMTVSKNCSSLQDGGESVEMICQINNVRVLKLPVYEVFRDLLVMRHPTCHLS